MYVQLGSRELRAAVRYRAVQHLLGWRHRFKADGGWGPPLGLRWMEPGVPMLNQIRSFVPYDTSPWAQEVPSRLWGSRAGR